MKAIEDEGATPELVSAWLGAALGDAKRLAGRKPDFAFFAMLLDRVEGKVPQINVEVKSMREVHYADPDDADSSGDPGGSG